MKSTIMLVDDNIDSLEILGHILCSQYDVVPCVGGRQAMQYLLSTDVLPALILLDVLLRDVDGFLVMEYLRGAKRFERIPVICITGGDMESTVLGLGASDYISKPFNADVIRLRVQHQMKMRQYIEDLEELVEEKTREAMATRDNVLDVMADIIEYRNLESGSHVRRVARYTAQILSALAKESAYAADIAHIGVQTIVKAVPMHDVGKIGIPDSILLKPGKLTKEEFEIMKTHTTIGKNIIGSILKVSDEESEYLRHCSDVAYCHHEWYDGSGYPQGLRGQEIPLSARIMAVADVYDALVTHRVYKEAMDNDVAVGMIYEERGTHFDPVVVDAFVRVGDNCCRAAKETLMPVS